MRTINISLGLALIASLLSACSDDAAQPEPAPPPHPLDLFADELEVTKLYSNTNADFTALIARGKELASRADSCANCHQPMGSATTGPSLADVAARYTRRFGGDATKAKVWLHHKIMHSKKYVGLKSPYYSMTLMPDFSAKFQPEDAQALVEYLSSLPAKE